MTHLYFTRWFALLLVLSFLYFSVALPLRISLGWHVPRLLVALRAFFSEEWAHKNPNYKAVISLCTLYVFSERPLPFIELHQLAELMDIGPSRDGQPAGSSGASVTHFGAHFQCRYTIRRWQQQLCTLPSMYLVCSASCLERCLLWRLR